MSEILIEFTQKVSQSAGFIAILMVAIEKFIYCGDSPEWFQNLGGTAIIVAVLGYFILIMNFIWC